MFQIGHEMLLRQKTRAGQRAHCLNDFEKCLAFRAALFIMSINDDASHTHGVYNLMIQFGRLPSVGRRLSVAVRSVAYPPVANCGHSIHRDRAQIRLRSLRSHEFGHWPDDLKQCALKGILCVA